MTTYIALFVSAFLSATLLPGTSDVGLAAATAMSDLPVVMLVAVVTLGNTLGSCVNWIMGLAVAHGSERVKLPGADKLDRFKGFYARYGKWSLLLSWLPIVGDPLTVLAGLARTPLWLFLPLVMVGKLLRYVAIAGLVWLGS
ncbi:MAG: DedA family protein [Alphaproteobacteria bacterium]|nr:DedA family protein [Alphaproteobacteria bacterium]